MAENEVGRMADGSWQAGMRRTFAVGPAAAWARLFSDAGLRRWLGEPVRGGAGELFAFLAAGGETCRVRVWRPPSHIRTEWRFRPGDAPATLQVRLLASGDQSTVAFHVEGLADAAAREAALAAAAACLDSIGSLLAEGSRPASQ
jgi:uncharacterized protein YndB with AHSA1/START domain